MTFAAMLLGDRVLRNPIIGIAGCCALVASGHAAVDATVPAMKSRRRITFTGTGPLHSCPMVTSSKQEFATGEMGFNGVVA
jgi:hypothetical protein